MSGPHRADAVHDHRQAGDDSRHEPVGKETVLCDIDQRDQRASAESLHDAPREQHRHRRGDGAEDAAEGVDEGRGHHGPAQAMGRHHTLDRRRGHDRTHQVQGEGPTDQPQAADVANRHRQRRGGQHRIGGMQPDRQAQREQPGQVRPGKDFTPADGSSGDGPDRALRWIPAGVVWHDGRVWRRKPPPDGHRWGPIASLTMRSAPRR